MIARTWHGRVPRAKGGAYSEFLMRQALPDYSKTPGNRGVFFFRREEGEVTHFLLLEKEPFVTHYEVLHAP
ncbi:MAG: hypothetical protein HY049_00500 [Acidobacteria bacterium]|nr:hypothetical protein [Acidobacteriota bacterium]